MELSNATEVAPLRALKKQRTAEALRATARSYLKDRPFDEARLSDIARDAEVSAKTLYNYFSTKLDLLYAVIQEDDIEFVKRARKLHARSWRDATEAIIAFARSFFGWLESYHRSALQALVAAAFVARSKEQSDYEHLDDLNEAAVVELVVALQAQRLIEPTLDAQLIGHLLFSLMDAEFYAFIGSEERTVDASCTSLRRQLEFIAPTWAPRRARSSI